MTENIVKTFGLRMSNAEYHAHKAISRSMISEIKRSPLHYYEKYINPPPDAKKESTAAMNIGSAVHTLVLEPYLFEAEFAIQEKVDCRTKSGKEYRDSFALYNADKIILSQDDFEKAKNIANAALSHRKSSVLMHRAEIESSFFWTDKETGIECKARPDILNVRLGLICDLKTTNDSTPDSFAHSVKKNNYHIQAAMQIDALWEVARIKIRDFCFLVAQNEPPYYPYFYSLDDEAIELGRQEYKDALKIIKKCNELEQWHIERERVISVGFNEYTLNNRFFAKLLGDYECQQN